MVKLCIFDMDGLLLDSEREVYLKTGVEVSEAIGHPLSYEFLTGIMGSGWDLYEGSVKRMHGEDYPFEEYWSIFWPKVQDKLHNMAIPLMPGTREILDYCRDNGIRMAVATSSHREVTECCLKNDGIYDYFDFLMTGDMVVNSKPHPEIYIRTMEQFADIDRNEILVIEDGHNGAQSARNAGCRYALVEDLAYLSDEDKAGAALCTDSLLKVMDYLKEENEGTAGV